MSLPKHLQHYESTAQALRRWAEQAQIKDGYIVESLNQIDYDLIYCDNCIDTAFDKAKESLKEEDREKEGLSVTRVDWDRDNLDCCGDCGVVLAPFLSQEGIAQEMAYYQEHLLQSPEDAAIFMNILDWVEYDPELEAVVELILEWYQAKQLALCPDTDLVREEESHILDQEACHGNGNRSPRRKVSDRRAARGPQTTSPDRPREA